MKRPQLFLIDGMAYLFRAYYGIRDLSNAKGLPTNALYGFTSILFRVVNEYQPEYWCVALDSKEPTLRKQQFEAYKADREVMPEDMAVQMPYVDKILEALNIPFLRRPGYEADDIMGTMARQAVAKGYDVVIVTGDKDMCQVVDDHISVLKLHPEVVRFDAGKVVEFFGVRPDQITDLLGLAGDSSDGIPGVPGIGVKTATALLQEFDSLETVLASVDKITGKKRKENLENFADQARLSKVLATLDFDVPEVLSTEACLYQQPQVDESRELFQELQFFKFLKDLGGEKVEEKQQQWSCEEIEDGDAWLERLESLETISVFYEQNQVFLYAKSQAEQVAVMPDSLFQQWAGFWAYEGFKIGFHVKELCHLAHRVHEGHLSSFFDVMLGAYLLSPGQGQYRIEQVVMDVLQEDLGDKGDEQWACRVVSALETCYERQEQLLKERGLWELWHEVELPLLFVLTEMEQRGMMIDCSVLQDLSSRLGWRLQELTDEIYGYAGQPFNINSPKQLAEVLFEKLELPVVKKTKTGYSTDVTVLETLAQEAPIAQCLLEYRQLYKLKTTYVDALPMLVDEESRIHTTFHQTGTATGRLSSSDPNLQNIPIRTELGREIRRAFIPSSADHVLISADYSQIELRVLAHLSQDETMKEAFRNDEDIHQQTAGKIYGVPDDEVTPDMRRGAKAINFGLIYGKTPFGLAKDLGVSLGEAKAFIDAYFQHFPQVKIFMESTVEKAREQGYVQTLLNRRRYIADIDSKNKMKREFAERMAINSTVQGSAADMIKVAMLKLSEALNKEDAQLLLQIHDELVVQCFDHMADKVMEKMVTTMEQSFSLDVPLKVQAQAGKNWADIH